MTGSEDDLPLSWQRSSESGGENCLEVAFGNETVLIRNSRNPAHEISSTHAEWRAFVEGILGGEFRH